MFTMMNNARLLVGIQGVAVAESATQKALAYAQDRKQGRAESYSGEGMAPIIHHPDVQRNVLTMQSLTAAARAISYDCAHAIDRSEETDETKPASYWTDRAALLTPLAKAFCTDVGCEVAHIGVQIHGGMGYVEETGAAQLLRDARIAPIYEGTNGIQAIDLVTRKLPLSGGEAIAAYIAELEETVSQIRQSNLADLSDLAEPLQMALDNLKQATQFMMHCMETGEKQTALCGATPYLRLMGLAVGGVYLGLSALHSAEHERPQRAQLTRFMAQNLCCETATLCRSIETGANSIQQAAPTLLAAEG